jgi:hypothetical protein
MTTFTLQDLTPAQQEAVKHHEAMHIAHQVVNTRSINDLPTTTEEDEAMKELFEKMGQDLTAQHAPAPQPTLADIVNSVCTQLQLLTTVLSQSQAETKAGENSLQECVSTTLQQADWFKEMVEEKIETLVDDMDHSYGIENAVETHFSNSFSLDDHVDITAEVESKVEDIAEDLLKDIVQEQLEEVVAEKLKNLRITFD